MLISPSPAREGGEKLTVRVTFPPDFAARVRAYSEAAGFGPDYPSLIAAAVMYVIEADEDFSRFSRADTPRRERPAARGRRKKTDLSAAEELPTGAETEPEKPPETPADTPAETVAATPDPLPRRGIFGGLRS